MQEEQWKDVYFEENGVIWDYRGLYQISNIEGRVKSLKDNNGYKREKILKPRNNGKGYLQVSLYKEGKRKTFKIHRLVLHVFDPDGYFDGAEVDHINTDKTDNRLENLRWVTSKENSNNPLSKKNYSKAKKSENNPNSKKIIGYSTTTTKVIILQSMNQAIKFGFSSGNISRACNGKYCGGNIYKGYRWFYLEDIKKGGSGNE